MALGLRMYKNSYNFVFFKKFIYTALLFLFMFSSGYAQLQQFSLEVTATDETCSGNGTLSFSITNGTQGATMSYAVYKEPDLVNPISISNANSLGSLSEGTYKVIATQSLGQQSNEQQASVTIVNALTPLAFKVSATHQTCVEGAKMIVTATSGTPALYEIISGPVTRPTQESNVFEPLPPGTYVIRVYDICGDADVTTFTLVDGSTPPAVSEPVYDNETSGDCDSVTVTNTISYGEGVAITYPLTVEYTLTPSNGDEPIVITETYENGDAVELALTHTFATDAADYTYDLKITDGCNSAYTKSGMVLNPEFSIRYTANVILPCGGHYLTIAVSNFSPPFTLDFTIAPDEFIPSNFNATHPGPFTNGQVIYGSDEQPIPNGIYQVTVTDNCGRTAVVDFGVEDEIVEPTSGASNNGCFSKLGRITISVPDRKIVSAIIEIAPEDYTQPLPSNVSANINSNGFVILTNVPVGEYTIRIVDECGKEYIVKVEIPDFEVKGFTANGMTGCVVGSGAVRITSGNGKLVTLTMTGAPDEYDGVLPQDVSSFIDSSGVFYMEGLPVGTYTFMGTDVCGVDGSVTASISANSPPANAVTFKRNCGNFNLGLADGGTTTLADPPTYWLQKRINAQSDSWGHPVTNVAYPENTKPTIQNSILLTNGQTLNNLEYEGNFRVIKYFESYISPLNIQACFGALDGFEYFDGVTVKSVYNLSCYQNSNDIYVDATGLAPLHYTISKKDGEPFALDNGNNSIFSGLDPGIYEFVVEDACGYIGRIEVNIRLLPELTNAHDPGDMLLCVEPNETLTGEFDLASQNTGILGDQPADIYTITYHLSQEDADNGVDAIEDIRTNTANPETIYARLIHNQIPLCHDVVSFALRVSEYPVLKLQQNYILCEDEGERTLYADPGFNSYQWSTGETTPSIKVSKSGNYWVKVGNNYDGFICETTADISVILSGPPETWYIDTDDWTENTNIISVITSGFGNYEYSLDGKDYQNEPYFTNLDTGIYTIYIRDKNGCGSVSEKVVLLNYPKFFTPNNDGINDTWRLEYSWFEPEALIYIYDRYGKLISSFTPSSNGWDGTFNGKLLPATDYWFVVKRKDGEIHKGHFAMIR